DPLTKVFRKRIVAADFPLLPVAYMNLPYQQGSRCGRLEPVGSLPARKAGNEPLWRPFHERIRLRITGAERDVVDTRFQRELRCFVSLRHHQVEIGEIALLVAMIGACKYPVRSVGKHR